jgi:RND family efflux transporter MFP subunit
MSYRLLKAALPALVSLGLIASGCAGGPGSGTPSPTPRGSSTPTSLEVVTVPVTQETLEPKLTLPGQINLNPTEEGAVSITTPMDGVVIRPLVKVGDFVQKDQAVAELNTVFGQSPLQLLTQLEGFQTAYMQALSGLVSNQTALAQARTALGQARAAVSAAQSALGQAEAELAAARADLRRKAELEKVGVFAKADVDEAKDRFGKADAVCIDEKNQLRIAKQLVPYAQRSVAEFEKAVAFGKNQAEVARSTYDRNKAVLLQSDLVGASMPPELLGSLQLNHNVNLDAASRASKFTIRAPISGILSDLAITPGLKITNSTPVGNVTDIGAVYADANAFETDVAPLRVGDQLECVSVSYPDQKFLGHVKYISRRVQSDTRAIVVRSLIANPDGLLRPGMFVKNEIHMPKRNNVLVVPDSAVLTQGDSLYVVVETQPGQFDRKPVSAGVSVGGKTEIKTGLQIGDKVVTQGNLLLNVRDYQK